MAVAHLFVVYYFSKQGNTVSRFLSATFGVETRRRSSRDVLRSKLRTAVYPPRMAPIGAKLWENAFQMIPNVSFSDTEKKIGRSFLQKILILEFFFQETGDLEEPDTFERHWQIRRKKLLPEVGLLLGRLPWRRGKRFNLCRKS